MAADLAILFEHPTWQKPLFDALEARGIPFEAIDLKRGAFDAASHHTPKLVFNQASPSAYVRGNGQAVSYALNLMDHFEANGARVLNGAAAFRFELSKIAQIRLLKRLGMSEPWTIAFNHVDGLASLPEGTLKFPAILKPNQGGSGARMAEVTSLDHLQTVLDSDPNYWHPDPMLLLQEKLEAAHEGIVRMEFVGGEMLYAMRVTNTAGFNLCPSEDCNPGNGETGACALPVSKPPEFFPYPDVAQDAVAEATRLFKATGFDVGGLEYMETTDGRRVFYDMNANSNLRRPIGLAMGFDPFDRVAAYLERELAR